MEYVGIPAIIIICYLVAEIFKLMILKKKNRYKYIPIIVGVTGGIIGIICYYISPEIVLNVESPIIALSIGILSGLASTGSNQILKQIIESKKENNKNE